MSEQPAAVIRATLRDRELEFDEPKPGSFLVKLPGTHKLATMTWLVVGDHALHVEAFFMRRPAENEAEFYRWLLQRNLRMFAVAFAIDNVGDVYLTGRLPLSAVGPDEIDHILGSVLSYADDYFDAALRLGFRSSIEREWDWRASRGESLANLAAFAHFADPEHRDPGIRHD
jgi:Putative bacterial sensory transduction regulator